MARPTWKARTSSTMLAAAIAVLLALAGTPRGTAEATAASDREASRMLAQAEIPADPEDPEAEEEEEVPIPENLLNDEPLVPPAQPSDTLQAPGDTLSVPGAPADSAAFRADSLGGVPSLPAEPETLFSVPPSMKPGAPKPEQADPIVERRPGRRGLLGLAPVVVLLGLAVIHFLVIQTVD